MAHLSRTQLQQALAQHLTSSVPLTGSPLLLLHYSSVSLPFLSLSRRPWHSALNIKVLLMVNKVDLDTAVVKGKWVFVPLFTLAFLSSSCLLTSILTSFSIDKAAGSLQRVDFKALLAQKSWPLKPTGVGINGRPCGHCI